MYIAERQSRKELEERNKIMKSIAYREHQEKEEELRKKAALARQTKNSLLESQVGQATEDDDEAKARDELRYIRNRELQSQMRQELNKKSKNNRDGERDISEKVALGQAQASTQEFAYDQRLFNQQSGVSAGFAQEEDYDVYDKPLFHDRSSVYKMTHARPQEEDANAGRNRPVEFEKGQEDIFGMDSFITDTVQKKVKK